jgi:hypothetical protein
MEINQLTQPSIMLTKAALTNRKNAAVEESRHFGIGTNEWAHSFSINFILNSSTRNSEKYTRD